MKRLYPFKLFILLCLLTGFGGYAGAQTVTTYSVVGTYTYTVTGTSLAIDMAGGQGGHSSVGAQGGKGGRVQCTLAVTPGQVLTIYVGGGGGNSGAGSAGGANGSGGGAQGGNGNGNGAGGGGSSDIRTGGTALSNRILVAAGGGGAGYNCASSTEVGGDGGGLTGGQGWQCGNQSTCTTGSPGTQTGAGNTGGNCTQISNGVQANGAGGSFTSYVGGGGGGYYGGGAGYYGGGGGGSSYIAGPGVTGASTTPAYQTGDGYVKITQLCTAPGSIVGSVPVCPASTITLSNPTGTGGIWVSSNTAVASVNSSTGVVTGVTAGTATITYQETNPCGGASATTTVTVLPLPSAIAGTTNACVGTTTTLSDGGTGTWATSNPSIATVSTSGVVTGVVAGTATISYTLTTGCAPATTTVTVYPTPDAIGGTLTTCASGGTTTLTDALSGGSWTSSTGSVATIGAGSGVVTGHSAGTSNITYTSANGCITSTTITVNPLPAAIAGSTSVCVGSTTTLTDPTSGGTWSSSNTSQATVGVGSGVVTGVTAGSPTITYTLAGTGCRTTAPVVVNPLPSAITGGSSVCMGATTALTDGGGGTWTSSNLTAATVNTFTGVVSGVGPGSTTITYTLGTGCSTSTSMVVNPLPDAYGLTGGGNYCAGTAGVHVGMAFASSGVNYVLYNTGSPVSLPIPGSNSGMDFGLQTAPGTYTVVATNAITGCSNNMTGSVTVSVNALPAIHNITGGGGYCVGTAGSPLGTDASDVGTNYQLYNGSTAVGPVVAGTGSPLSFGSYTATGTYTVLATNPTTGCSQWQGSNAIITVTAAPTAYNVTGGGSFCAGGSGVTVGLGNSEAGTLYQLYRGTTPVGSPVLSSGGAVNFGLFNTAGTYTAIATNISGCTANMTGSVTIVINPLPAINTVTGGGGYCSGGPGVHIGLSFSTPGITYSLIYGGSGTVTTMAGSGSGLDFGLQTVGGTYTVLAVNNTTLCSSNMSGSATITVNPLPDNSYNVLGSGSYCLGDAGRDISLDGSEFGVNYQLYKGTSLTGVPMTGTGGSLDFGMYTPPATYTVKGTNAITGCTSWMTGSAVISANPLPALHTVTGGGSYCDGGAGAPVGLNGSNTGILYQLIEGGSIINTLSGTGGTLDFGMQLTPGTYTITAMDSLTGCMRNMLGSATIAINPVPAVNTVTGGGSYCAGGTGFHVGLDGSVSGISYQLYNGTTAVGGPSTGSGSALDFGLKTAAGIYTVTATNPLTGCGSAMLGNAIINVNSLPNLQVLAGGGNYCAGGAGMDVNLDNSDIGISYQLYRYGVAEGAAINGTGGPAGFGLDSFGVYTAKATDLSTGCMSDMLGTVTINTVSPVAYLVTGGGSYCEGGTGVLVGQSGSSLGVSYQLMSGGSPVGTAMAGTGTALDFGLVLAAGIYTVQATDTTLGCVGDMTGSATIGINSLPVAQNVTGGGSFCAGGGGAHVGLDNSVSGVNYQLYNGTTMVGAAVGGTTGSTLDFGLETAAGTYTATATDAATGCMNLMTGSAAITIMPTPVPYAVTIENSGNYCAGDTGVHISLPNSEIGVDYQLFRGSTLAGASLSGTGSMLVMGLETIAGTYTVVANNPTSGCSANMPGTVTVNIVPLPNAHMVTGGGGFCSGGTGVHVGLDGSDAGIYYQLYNGTSPLATLYGTGTSLDFGLQATPGIYTVIANSAITPCQNTMFGTADVHYDSVQTPVLTLHAYPGTGVGVWEVDSIKVLVTSGGPNPTYQWYVNGHLIAGATTAVFTSHEFFNNDSVSCTVTGSGPCGGGTATGSVIIRLLGVGVQQLGSSVSDIRLVPNPNKGVFSLRGNLGSGAGEELQVEVTNMLGQVVYHGTVHAQNGSIDQQLDLGSPASGMYLLNLRSGTEQAVFHFVVE